MAKTHYHPLSLARLFLALQTLDLLVFLSVLGRSPFPQQYSPIPLPETAAAGAAVDARLRYPQSFRSALNNCADWTVTRSRCSSPTSYALCASTAWTTRLTSKPLCAFLGVS